MINQTYTKKQLTTYSKEAIIDLLLSTQQANQQLVEISNLQKQQLEALNQKMDLLIEQISLSKKQRFGRSTEKLENLEQLEICFNEAEVTIEGKDIAEPDMEEIYPKPYHRKKSVGKREEDLKGIPVKVIEHTLSEEELIQIFGKGWRRLPDEVYKRLTLRPVKFEVQEHHVAVYCGGDDDTIIKADRPVDLLRNSILTPSLMAAILNFKYVNAMPLYRLEQEFARHDVNISRQVMANWTITCGERYLSLLYDRMHRELLTHHVIQADETPVSVTKDGRATGSKSYMWVYRTGKMYKTSPIILYDYRKTRQASHPSQYLQGYEGTIVTDGYEAYHKMARENEGLIIAGCWSHARRRFANALKSIGKKAAKGTLAHDALKQISIIYKIDNELQDLEPEKRLHRRQLLVKPQVEAFFEWIKKHRHEVQSKSETGKGFTYCINQEEYLKVFLDNAYVPLDNNSTENAIRGFCIGRKNWKLIDTIHGAKSSAIIYSITETAKANGLKLYDYLKYLFEEIPKHMEDKDLSFLDELLPWSETIPDEYRRTK